MAGRLILTTVGTSALAQEKLERLYLWTAWQNLKISLPKSDTNRHHTWKQEQIPRAIDLFVNEYIDFLIEQVVIDDDAIKEELNKPRRGLINVLSAEITSLYLVGLDPKNDSVVFLLSDSPEGVICGLINSRLFQKKFSIIPELIVVQGLQSENFKDFFDTGLTEYTRIIARSVEAHVEKRPILNATGGFKSLIPYASYLALAHGMPIYFVFEELPEPIWVNLGQAELKPEEREKLEQFQKFLLNRQDQFPKLVMGHPIPQWE